MKVDVIIERNSDGFYSMYMDDDNLSFGLNGQGDSVEEAKKEMLTAYEEIKEMNSEDGIQTPDLEFEYNYDVASFLDYYSGVLSKSGLEKITGINQKQLWHYSSGNRMPKKETVLKIQESLHRLGKELSQVHFVD